MRTVKEIRELCDKATPGPWKAKETSEYSEIYDSNAWGKELNPLALVGSNVDDADFIAQSREIIPALLDELEAAQGEARALSECNRKLIEQNRRLIWQGWIPVTERLPDNSEYDWVLAQVKENNGYLWIPKVMEYRASLDDWFGEEIGWIKNHNGAFSVTHWMPLPEPPKGE